MFSIMILIESNVMLFGVGKNVKDNALPHLKETGMLSSVKRMSRMIDDWVWR